jgi:hypothetical protein
MATHFGSPVLKCPLKSGAIKERHQDPKKKWIKFEIHDEKGKKMQNVTIQVTLPDNTIAEMTSDKSGMIEINNIDPGICRIKFDWKDLKVYDCVLLQK